MARPGLAATLVSVVVFSLLLLANSILFSAQNAALSSYSVSSIEQKETLYSHVLLSSSAYTALEDAQRILQSGGLDCLDPNSAPSALRGTQDSSGTYGGLRYSTNSSWSYSETAAPGRLPMLGGLDGYRPGVLNLLVSTSIREAAGRGLPIIESSVVSAAHIGASLAMVASECRSALAAVEGALRAVRGCNASGVAAAVEGIRAMLGGQASSRGLGLTLAGGVSAGTGGCLVRYSVTVTEADAQGVRGRFAWSEYGAGAFEQ